MDHMASSQASEHSVVHPTLSQVMQAMEALWPVSLQQGWDASGIVAGRPEQTIQRIHWAVDPVQAVADEAVANGADLVVTHHPLFLRPVTSMAATTFKGKVLHTLVEPHHRSYQCGLSGGWCLRCVGRNLGPGKS